MDRAAVIFEGIGMLGTAYILGYPIAWAADKVGNVLLWLGSNSAKWQEFNRLSDELYGSPMPQVKLPKLPWRK
jgi:hypothetical protein